jgi:hypothetical protein
MTPPAFASAGAIVTAFVYPHRSAIPLPRPEPLAQRSDLITPGPIPPDSEVGPVPGCGVRS